MQISRPMARAALQGHELMPRTRGGGVAGIDYEDEHEAFAASRSSDYIYESGNEAAFDALDSHAETIEGDAKLPLVITGSTGCGKSALLANWVNRRRKMKHRDEFLFQHFVGCSPRSKQLAHLLYRLESALKEHFQLREMEVPTSEERLRWSLNRFLAAAAKKQFPARIVIVMDAVNRLRGESSAADTLHWLPTELPQGVRIIVSTVELEQNGSLPDDFYDEGSRVHRTYTELRRRKCPTIRLQPLSVEVRHLIIGSFLKVNQQALQSLEQAQQFRLVTAKASSQPLFLRTILYALRLGFEMSEVPVDQQIDVCLAAETSSQLIARVLELCSDYVDLTLVSTETEPPSPALQRVAGTTNQPTRDESDAANIFARVLTALFASRHGLSDAEMWGIVELATSDPLPLEQRECIRRVLRDYTFSVNGLRNFSHEDYAVVVYNEYIRSPEVHVRAHQLMARYFGKLPPCDRKLDALPYHLEVSGSWSRLRAALVDVQMFRLWWTAAHKTEFLNLWASLTACSNTGAPIRKLVTGEFDDTMRCAQPPRPCLDVVDEYVRSVDDYKFVHSPSDDELASVILHIADFMLEFATLSLEEAADVPQFVHPTIPNEDLASLGVPFLSRDKDGNSVLNTPHVEASTDKGSLGAKPTAMDTPMKVNEEIPLCSTYFYHRWMWIQFPWVSLANCGERFLQGVAHQTRQEQNGAAPGKSIEGRLSVVDSKVKPAESQLMASCSRNLSSAQMAAAAAAAIVGARLPEIRTFSPGKEPGNLHIVPGPIAAAAINRSAQKCKVSSKQSTNQDRLTGKESLESKTGYIDHFAVRVEQLRTNIGSYRSELDQLRQERVNLGRVFNRTHDEMLELSKMHLSTSDLEAKLNRLVRRLEQTIRGHKMAKLLYKNYECVKLMCERHPAHSQALIGELEAKLTQDTLFIREVRQRLRETTFESHDFAANNKVLQHAAQEMTVLQNDMLVQRIRQREHLQSMSVKEAELNQQREKEISPKLTDSLVNDGSTKRDVRISGSENGIQGRPPKRIVGRNQNAYLRREVLDQGSCLSATEDASDGILLDLASCWEEYADLIRKRTFITDIKEFFGKFYNAQTLQTQMRSLHNAAELRQRELKRTLNIVEAELEQVRYDSQSIVGSNSREARELQIRLSVQLGHHKHARETALAAERLRQAAFGGIKHVCTTLGIPPPDQDTPVNEIIHQVESVLEALMEEKDKTAQKIGDPHQSNFRETSSGYEKLMRAPELDAALEQFETPKALIAHRLPAKAPDETRMLHEDPDSNPVVDDGEFSKDCVQAVRICDLTGDIATRSDVKREAHKNVRAVQRRLARLSPQ